MFLPRFGSATSARHSCSMGISRTLIARRHQPVIGLDCNDAAIFWSGVLAPHVLEQDGAAGLEFLRAHPAQQHLLVEGHHQVGLVAAVGDVAGADADAVAAGAGHAARRRTDLGRNDLGGPDAVAHLRGDRAQRLAALLRALARIADDLDDVLLQRDGFDHGGAGCGHRGRLGSRARARNCVPALDPEERAGAGRVIARRSDARCRGCRDRPSCCARPCGPRPWLRSRWPRR